jgi:hypothetical protein
MGVRWDIYHIYLYRNMNGIFITFKKNSIDIYAHLPLLTTPGDTKNCQVTVLLLVYFINWSETCW